MSLQKYAAMLKTVELGSISLAAEQMGYTQPAVSRMIADLENYNQCIFDNNKNNKSYHMDSYNFIKSLKDNVDIIYMDPPYPKTMNKYGEFYGCSGYPQCRFTKKP